MSKIIDERRKKIEDGLKMREEAEQMIAEINKNRLEILKRAEEEKVRIIESAKIEKEARLKEIRNELELIKQRELEKIENQKNSWQNEFYSQLYQNAPEILAKLAHKVFRDEKLNKEFIENMLNYDKAGNNHS